MKLCSLCAHSVPLKPEAMPEVVVDVLPWSRDGTTCSSSHLDVEVIAARQGTNCVTLSHSVAFAPHRTVSSPAAASSFLERSFCLMEFSLEA